MNQAEYEAARRPVTPRIRDLWEKLKRGLQMTRPVVGDYCDPLILKTRKFGDITYKFVREIEICGANIRLFLKGYEFRHDEQGILHTKHEFRFTMRLMLDDYKEWVACEPGMMLEVKDEKGKKTYEPVGESSKKSPEAWAIHLFKKMYHLEPDVAVEVEPTPKAFPAYAPEAI